MMLPESMEVAVLDWKRVTAILRFEKARFLEDRANIQRMLKEAGATEFQRVTGEANPFVELHVDFPSAAKLSEFKALGLDVEPKQELTMS